MNRTQGLLFLSTAFLSTIAVASSEPNVDDVADHAVVSRMLGTWQSVGRLFNAAGEEIALIRNRIAVQIIDGKAIYTAEESEDGESPSIPRAEMIPIDEDCVDFVIEGLVVNPQLCMVSDNVATFLTEGSDRSSSFMFKPSGGFFSGSQLIISDTGEVDSVVFGQFTRVVD